MEPTKRSSNQPAPDDPARDVTDCETAEAQDLDQDLGKGAQSWSELAARLDRFTAAWEEAQSSRARAGSTPRLPEFLPASGPLRRLALVEMIKIDLEYRYQRPPASPHQPTPDEPTPDEPTYDASTLDASQLEASGRQAPKRVEEYFQEFPELLQGDGPPCDLIYEEFHIRRTGGENVTPHEYYQRFPQQAQQLKRLMNLGEETITTALASAGRQRVDLQPLERIDDFQVITTLGKGAFGSVYLARQISMQRLVALKISADKGDEPRTLAQLEHPHIVRVYDQRRDENSQQRLLYMQFVGGGTLHDVIERARPIPLAERTGRVLLAAIDAAGERNGQTALSDSSLRKRIAEATWPQTVCRIGAQLAQALSYAHGRGILHRDVKPANVLMAIDGAPRLADFNISFNSQVAGATPAAYFGGSLAYMSPEQLEACNTRSETTAEDLDERSDIYSLGVVLWEMVHGRRPFQDERKEEGWDTTLAVMIQKRRTGIQDPPTPSLDDTFYRLREVLLRCLAPNPADRPADGAALERDLRLCLNPRALAILKAPERRWREMARRFPFIAVFAAAVIPHAFAAVFNYFYNQGAVVQTFEHPRQVTYWNWLSLVMNATAFPLGAFLTWWLVRPVAKALGNPETRPTLARSAQTLDDEGLSRARRVALRLGHYTVAVGVSEWVVAGMMYPLVLNLLPGGLNIQQNLAFLASLVFCGLIAGSYPFFLVTLLSIRVFYPALLAQKGQGPERAGGPIRGWPEEDAPWLERLSQQSTIYLPIAGGVPMLAVLILAVFRPDDQQYYFALLAALGAAGLIVSYLLLRVIQNDLKALQKALSPSLDSFAPSSKTF